MQVHYFCLVRYCIYKALLLFHSLIFKINVLCDLWWRYCWWSYCYTTFFFWWWSTRIQYIHCSFIDCKYGSMRWSCSQSCYTPTTIQAFKTLISKDASQHIYEGPCWILWICSHLTTNSICWIKGRLYKRDIESEAIVIMWREIPCKLTQ